MKKIFGIILCALFVVILVSACSSRRVVVKHPMDSSKGTEYRVQ